MEIVLFKLLTKENSFLLVLKRRVPVIEIIARVRKDVKEHPYLIAHYRNETLVGGMTCSAHELNTILNCIEPQNIRNWKSILHHEPIESTCY